MNELIEKIGIKQKRFSWVRFGMDIVFGVGLAYTISRFAL